MIDKWKETIKDMLADAKDLWSDFRHKHKRKILIGLIAVSLLAIPALTSAGPAVPDPVAFTIDYTRCATKEGIMDWAGGLIIKAQASDNGDGTAALLFAIRTKELVGVDLATGDTCKARGGDRYKDGAAPVGALTTAITKINTSNFNDMTFFWDVLINPDMTVDYTLREAVPYCNW